MVKTYINNQIIEDYFTYFKNQFNSPTQSSNIKTYKQVITSCQKIETFVNMYDAIFAGTRLWLRRPRPPRQSPWQQVPPAAPFQPQRPAARLHDTFADDHFRRATANHRVSSAAPVSFEGKHQLLRSEREQLNQLFRWRV